MRDRLRDLLSEAIFTVGNKNVDALTDHLLANGVIVSQKPSIDPTDDHFGCILNCAVRYSVGRATYMPSLVMDFIRPLLPYVSDKTLFCLERDIEGAEGYKHWSTDLTDWVGFLEEVKAEADRREAEHDDIDLLTNLNDRM